MPYTQSVFETPTRKEYYLIPVAFSEFPLNSGDTLIFPAHDLSQGNKKVIISCLIKSKHVKYIEKYNTMRITYFSDNVHVNDVPKEE